MRASLPLMVVMALAGFTAPCLAQAAPDQSSSDKPPQAAPGPQGKSDVLSPSTLPTARQSVTEEGHIDALSPDEARRIERARARAAARARPTAKVQPAETQAAPAKSAEPTPMRAANEPHAPSTPARDAAAPKATAPAAPKEAEKAPAPAPSKAPPAKEAATPPAPAAQATRDAHVTERPEKARPQAIRHAAHPVRSGPPRAVANVEPRHLRQRPDWPWRRPSELAERTPRVGDVVPSDVPLYPVPPGYVPPRPYPPFPHARDQARDDYAPPPPPRGFMEPY